MTKPIVIIWDCGATNFRTIAIDITGNILAEARKENHPIHQPGGQPDWLIWDIDKIFSDLCELTNKITSELDASAAIKALAITTWGADAAPVNEKGELVYPLISWQCPRTNYLVEKIKQQVPPKDIFAKTGYQVISFNTLLKMIWIKENAPHAWDKMYKMLTVTGILNHKLTGNLSVDPTMAGTTMAFNISNRYWDKDMLALAETDESVWPDLYEPGTVIGTIKSDLASKLNLPAETPVIAAGHDTQFALYGSCGTEQEAVLSSGTWEILMARTKVFEPSEDAFHSGIIIEQDAQKGFIDPQFLMMGSGTLEWIRKQFWAGDTDDVRYEKMISEAQDADPGSGGLIFLANFMHQTGPAAPYKSPGSIIGLSVTTKRGQIYRAGLEGLSMQLRHALDIFSKTLGFNAKAIRIVGGGAKNPLWNRIRADVTGLPIITTKHKEATVLGAAMFAFVGVGEFANLKQARENIDVGQEIIEPSQTHEKYQELYERYINVVKNLGKLIS